MLDSFVWGKVVCFSGYSPHPLKALRAARFAKVRCRILNARELEAHDLDNKAVSAFRVLCHEPLAPRKSSASLLLKARSDVTVEGVGSVKISLPCWRTGFPFAVGKGFCVRGGRLRQRTRADVQVNVAVGLVQPGIGLGIAWIE